MSDKPNPGSDEAVKAGCQCPVLDNARGRGIPWGGQTVFYVDETCPLHGRKKETTND